MPIGKNCGEKFKKLTFNHSCSFFICPKGLRKRKKEKLEKSVVAPKHRAHMSKHKQKEKINTTLSPFTNPFL